MRLSGQLFALAIGLPTVAAAEPPAAAQSLDAIILGGGKSREDAEKVLAMWPLPWGADIVRPLPGFPKIVESATVAGLKPGFHIVVLGYCDMYASVAPVEAVRWIFSGTYTRTVTGVNPACPAIVGNKTPRSYESVERDGLTLEGMSYEMSHQEALVVMLMRGDAALEGQARTFSTERKELEGQHSAEQCGRPELTTGPGGLVVEWECTSEWGGCCWEGPERCPEVTSYRVDYRVADGHIVGSESNTVTAYEGTCGE